MSKLFLCDCYVSRRIKKRAEEIGARRERKGESVESGSKKEEKRVASTLDWLQRPPAMNQLI